MKIVTYINNSADDIQAATAEEWQAMPQKFRDSWEEWVWQDQPSKEAALARHQTAFDAWHNDNEAGNPIKDFY